MFENEFMSPSERLTAFLDGELTQEEAGTLFYELAQNPELQDEMRQLMAIRNTFRNSMLVPPDILKTKVFKRAGFSDSPMSGISRTAAALTALFYSRSMITAVAVFTLGILSYIMMPLNWGTATPNKDVAKNAKHKSVPIISSNEKNSVSFDKSQNIKSESQFANAVIISQKTNKTKSDNLIKNKKGKFFSADSDNNTTAKDNPNTILALNDGQSNERLALPIYDISHSLMANDAGIFFNINRYNNQLNYNNTIDLHRLLENFDIQLKSFFGVSVPNFEINNKNVSLLNNFSLGLNYTLSDHHAIGLAFGFENYLMSFDKYDGDILYTYKQSYNTEWLAATYQYSFDELGIVNIRPNINFLAGGTKVGPILKIGIGASLYLNDNIALIGGYESGWLFYPNKSDWVQGEWFSTNKNGIMFGIKLGF